MTINVVTAQLPGAIAAVSFGLNDDIMQAFARLGEAAGPISGRFTLTVLPAKSDPSDPYDALGLLAISHVKADRTKGRP